MARVSRLAGAILMESEGEFFLVGEPKEPCDFAAAGFTPPADRDAVAQPFVRLDTSGTPALTAPCLHMPQEGEAAAEVLTQRFLIRRNASVSERLWNVVTESARRQGDSLDAGWLGEMPAPVWDIVRATVLRCV